MTLTFETIEQDLPSSICTAEHIYALTDLTRLDEQASEADLSALIKKAQNHNVAAICVYPQHLAAIPSLNTIQRATVVNFPRGDQTTHQVLQTIEDAVVQQQADEIDYVFPYHAYLAGQTRQALAHCQEAYKLCQYHKRLFKVILETGALSSTTIIYRLSREVIDTGCDMLKTSTGKINIGASLPAVFTILTAIKESGHLCGVKVSGGIKTLQQASQYSHLAEYLMQKTTDKSWFRIGASGISDKVSLDDKYFYS